MDYKTFGQLQKSDNVYILNRLMGSIKEYYLTSKPIFIQSDNMAILEVKNSRSGQLLRLSLPINESMHKFIYADMIIYADQLLITN